MKKYFLNIKVQALLFILLCMFHIRFGIIPGWNNIVSDFPNYYGAASLVKEGKNPFLLYNDSLFNVELKRMGINVQGQFSLYPPPTAYVLLPLSGMEPLTAKRVWLIINLVLLGTTILLLSKIAAISLLLSADILLLAGFGLANDLMLGQVYLLLLALTSGGFLLVKRGRMLAGSVLWGMVMVLKYFTVMLIPLYLFRGKFRVLAGILLTFFLINYVCLLDMGVPLYRYFIENIFAPHLEGRIIGETAFSTQFQSFESLFNRLFTKDPVHNPFPFYESESLFFLCKTIAYAIPVGLTVRLMVKARQSAFFEEIYICLVLPLILLLEPGSASYHLLLLVLPVSLALRLWLEAMLYRECFLLLVSFAAIGFLSVVLNRLASEYHWPLLAHYQRLWFFIGFEIILIAGMQKFLNRPAHFYK